MRRGIPNYDESEVEALIREYHTLRAGLLVDRAGRRVARIAVRLADLDQALARVPDERWRVVLLHGLIGASQDETARLLSIKQQTVLKRYRKGIEDVVHFINGGES